MDRPFHVDLPEQDLTFLVPSHQTLVQAAADHGVEIPTACENGQCGTCLVRVLEGEVEHRDQALTPERRQEGWMCACVSRAAQERLTLELW